MAALWKALEEEAKKRKLNERVVFALADAAMNLRVRNPAYRNQAEVTNQVAKYDLKKLADEGLLIPKGEKKGRFYLAGEAVREIRRRTTAEPKDGDPFDEAEEEAQPDLPGFTPKPS